jgi:hypothetical protein
LADRLTAAGIEPIFGSLADLPALEGALRSFDAAVFAPVIPFEEEPPALTALISAFEGTQRPFVYTSGTGVLSIESHDGHWRQEKFSEEDSYEPNH